MRVQLDSANWADLKEVSDLRRGDRKAVNEKIVFEGDPATGRPVIRASMDDDMAEAVLEHVVTDWSLQLPLPAADPYRPASADGKTPENPGCLSKLTLEQDDALREAIKPHLAAIRGETTPTKDNPDPTVASAS
jgi:hypothetical protein